MREGRSETEDQQPLAPGLSGRHGNAEPNLPNRDARHKRKCPDLRAEHDSRQSPITFRLPITADQLRLGVMRAAQARIEVVAAALGEDDVREIE